MAAADREIPAEDSIKVVCRFRPLNDSEEKAGSKFVVKFPQGQEENCISIGVSWNMFQVTSHRFFRNEKIFLKKKNRHEWMSQATFRVICFILC